MDTLGDMISTLGSHLFRLILPFLPLLLSFACGYGVRELISRRRRAAARDEFLRRQSGKDALFEASLSTPPNELCSRSDVLSRRSSVPAKNGLYAWYFSDVPKTVPTEGCLMVDGKKLLYIGVAPERAGKSSSRQSLMRHIQHHYKGDAERSPLRRTLGVLLEKESKFPLRRVGSGKRITLTRAGERYLDEWMERNAFVAWMECPEPWVLERALLSKIPCPLNFKGNDHHPFAPVLKRMRRDALRRARELPVAGEAS